MDFLDYIAATNSLDAQAIIQKYGYTPVAGDSSELASCMEQLIAQEGEPAYRDVLSIHPDKGAILEEFGDMSVLATGGCGCAKCKSNGHGQSNMQGQGVQEFLHAHQAGIFILGGVLILSLVVLGKK